MEKKYSSLGEFLEVYFVEKFAPEYRVKQGKLAKENDFAKWLGLSNQNYSQYKLNNRRPSVEQADRMASKLGPMVYDLLGMPRRMPKDPLLHYVADRWSELTEDGQKEVAEIVKNKLTDTRNERPKRNSAQA